MKLTKSKLKQIIREAYEETLTGADDMPETGGDLLEELKDLLDDWEPETDEGIRYKSDLAEVVERHSEDYSEEEEHIDAGGEGLAGSSRAATLAAYKENPEFFN